ncbi:hypothetical protein FEM48_Zijuj06G0172800 [Ziziphus jujuba var. spinosa]|uniref:Gfo/Idh/MocA-like oxidoreductase N-terminal domain-containing protein n=1 Tax=Ziziphus jujuba var. spinosa TaxID=714518 RepID=A0A978VAK8_ZIZJJ|nr:hypothetical protein FEM48_Zijuj06G0172800 [Ziziphus jujuba var. spinosa]
MGCANIARKLSRAITLAPNATLAAVGSRSLEKAKAFASANNFPPNAKVYGSYEEVLDDEDVDAVYVPLPTGLHLRWAVLAAKKKKHILLEKPVSLNVAEFDAIVDACESNGVQIMDATMWMHHPRTAQMKDFLSDTDRFGHLKMMNTYFCYAGDEEFLKKDIRVKPELDGLGALGDAGWYCIRAILWAADYQLPNKVKALRGAVHNDKGVILSCGSSLHWEDGKVATFHCSFLSHLTMDITAIGTKGTFYLKDFVIPFDQKEANYFSNSQFWVNDISCWVPTPKNQVLDLPQEALMVKEFSRLVGEIKNGSSKPETKWPIISRKTQLVVDAVKASIDKGFETVEL